MGERFWEVKDKVTQAGYQLSTRLNVIQGTINESKPSLCRTCRNITIMKGPAESQRIFWCHRFGKLQFEAYNCTAYADKRTPSLQDMYDLAWQLRSEDSPKGKVAWGFYSPKQMKEQDERAAGEVDDE